MCGLWSGSDFDILILEGGCFLGSEESFYILFVDGGFGSFFCFDFVCVRIYVF